LERMTFKIPKVLANLVSIDCDHVMSESNQFNLVPKFT